MFSSFFQRHPNDHKCSTKFNQQSKEHKFMFYMYVHTHTEKKRALELMYFQQHEPALKIQRGRRKCFEINLWNRKS